MNKYRCYFIKKIEVPKNFDEYIERRMRIAHIKYALPSKHQVEMYRNVNANDQSHAAVLIQKMYGVKPHRVCLIEKNV